MVRVRMSNVAGSLIVGFELRAGSLVIVFSVSDHHPSLDLTHVELRYVLAVVSCCERRLRASIPAFPLPFIPYD